MNIATLFAPKATDVPYVSPDDLIISLICMTDSYKFTHPFMFKELNKQRKAKGEGRIVGMTSYGEARVNGKHKITKFGMQMFLGKTFAQGRKITMAHIDAAEQFALDHFGRPLFARADWEKVVNVYDGLPPLIIRSVPEGTVVRGGLPLYSNTVIDEDLFWMSSGFETMLLRGIWYPTTIATLDGETKRELTRFYEISGADMNLLPFALHDFAGRGVTCGEQAQYGGGAHTVYFTGSDTVEGVLAANYYYASKMSAFSVFATEHSVECSFGLDDEGEKDYIRAVLAHALPGTVVSIVLDGKDMDRCVDILCAPRLAGGFREDIIESNAKVVFRPDSGDMFVNIPRILRKQENAFGTESTSKPGYRRIKHVGIIQGDGVDRLNMLTVTGNIMAMGYSADCVIFGSGGALLQKVDRDTLKFAQKGSAILVRYDDGTEEWIGIAKDPITDPGKKSKEGVMTTVRSKMTGELMAARLDQGPLNEDFEDIMQLDYYLGQLYNKSTMDDVRTRAH